MKLLRVGCRDGIGRYVLRGWGVPSMTRSSERSLHLNTQRLMSYAFVKFRRYTHFGIYVICLMMEKALHLSPISSKSVHPMQIGSTPNKPRTPEAPCIHLHGDGMERSVVVDQTQIKETEVGG
ncbi:hypothetical protein MUK42_32944 [Musa troglodytarum]|uniref:Uncharacterized protein n=1 Tax=Musa troglodytarum TaxID=320322 RepID=A0A9E7I8I7_9LILI|nr:hypothetical protein MUK42_32944 [Musa troglodytarum]